MPIFTGTPVNVAPDPFLWIHDLGVFSGRFHYGGAMYLVGFIEDQRLGIAVAKSTDGGASWTVFNQQPAPWNGSLYGFPFTQQWVLDPSAGKLIFVSKENNLTAGFVTFFFDLVGETFSSVTDIGFQVERDYGIAIRPSGDVVAIYTPNGSTDIYYIPIVANAFGTPGVIDTDATTLRWRAAISDASGVVHVFYRHSSPSQLLYITLDASNTPGTRQTVETSSSGDDLSNALVSMALDQIVVAAAFEGLNFAFFGSPVSGPTWTKVPLHSATAGLSDQEMCAVDAGTHIKFLYQHQSSTFPVTQIEIMEVDWDGSTMGAPQVYWDVLANRVPSTIGLPDSDIFTDGITADLAAGTLGVAVTTTVNSLGDFSAVYLSTAGGPTSGSRNKFTVQVI